MGVGVVVEGLTQLLAGEAQSGGVLVQVFAEVDAQVAQLLLDALDLLQSNNTFTPSSTHSPSHSPLHQHIHHHIHPFITTSTITFTPF